MAINGLTRNLKFSDGVPVAEPSIGIGGVSGSLSVFVDDAAYVTAKGSAAALGDIYKNSTSNLIRFYNGSSWREAIDENTAQTMLNKILSGGTGYDFADVAIAANTFAKPAKTVARITSGTGPLNTITGASNGNILIVENKSGTEVVFVNENAGFGFTTGTGNDLKLADDASITLVYNSTDTYWSVIGGSGGGGGLELVSIDNTDSPVATEIGKHYICDVSTASIVATLPAGEEFASIRFSDATGDMGPANFVTLTPSAGETINGYAADETLLLDVGNAWVQLNWDVDNSIWVVDDQYGATTVGGGLATVIKTASFTAENNKHYLCDTTSAAITVTLPTVADLTKIRFSDLARNFGTNALTIEPAGAETIDEKTSYTLSDDTAWLQIMGDSASSNWICDKSVIAGNGAEISYPTSFTPTSTQITGGTQTGQWRKVGNFMEATYYFAGCTWSSSGWTIDPPTGYTFETSLLTQRDTLGTVTAYSSSGANYRTGSAIYNGSGGIWCGGDNAGTIWNNARPFAWTNGADYLTVQVSVPITGWEGSTTNTQTQVEYAYNSSTTTATDTTSFAYGPDGKEVESFAPSATGSVTKRVRFQNDIKDTDSVVLQLQSRGDDFWSSNNASFSSIPTPLTFYGIFLERVTGNNTDVDVQFMSKPNAAAAWSAFETEGLRWRVVKHTNAAMTGVDHGTSLKRGLVGGSNGVAVQAGYIGEVIHEEVVAASGVSIPTSGDTVNVTSIPLDEGAWAISSGVGYSNTGQNTTQLRSGVSIVSATLPSGDYSTVPNRATGEYRQTNYTSSVSDYTVTIPTYTVNIATPDTLYLVADAVFGGGTQKAFGFIQATRIS